MRLERRVEGVEGEEEVWEGRMGARDGGMETVGGDGISYKEKKIW